MKRFEDFLKEANIKWYKEGELDAGTPIGELDEETIDVIEEIDEVVQLKQAKNWGKNKGGTYIQDIHTSGYRIKTNKNEYKFLINNEQNCCENWGYLSSDDDLQSYIGAKLLDISVVDKGLKVTKLRLMKKMGHEKDHNDDRDTSTMFINLETSEGLLQFVAYNSHNGYYGHEVFYIINGNVDQQKRL